jgi:hypothetical protein
MARNRKKIAREWLEKRMDEQRRRFAEECGKEYPPLKDEDVDEFFKWLQSKKMTQEEFIEKALEDMADLNAALKNCKD